MKRLLPALAVLVAIGGAAQAEGELNVYSSRHYDTDDQLYNAFTEATGIKVNRIEAEADELIARLEAEGANSPADVFITVDAGRMWRAEQKGLLQPVESAVLEERIPEALRHPDNLWFGISTRARVIFYAKDRVENPPQTYADLADPAYKGKVCIRSGFNIYNLSLLASIIEHEGEEAARAWAEGVKANLAREPEGGDTDQLKAIVSGQCDIAVANTYYLARAIASQVDGLTGSTDQIGIVFPNQETTGTHVNVSAAAVAAHAPNRDNAVKFLEYLTSDSAQEYFAGQNNEYPAVPGLAATEAVTSLGAFRADELNLAALGRNQAAAERIFTETGWK
ncbi:MAG: Fe(3+) ABC transporter substrate-binding protein [Rhodobacteraceae bacterium]|nr:Fe(3+) ABC transporter substrate-binding protein [Paracoccaceae bacterium]